MIKSGTHTTEFWLTVVTQVITLGNIVAGTLPPKQGTLVMAGLSAAYTFARTLLKAPDITTAVQLSAPSSGSTNETQ